MMGNGMMRGRSGRREREREGGRIASRKEERGLINPPNDVTTAAANSRRQGGESRRKNGLLSL